MRGWIRTVLLGALMGAAAAACARAGDIAAPQTGDARKDGGTHNTPPPADSTDRWGGFIGGGG